MTLQDQLEPGESLLPGQSKVSNGNLTRLDFKPDGNLVLTNIQTGQPTWSSNTRGQGGATVSMQGNGPLVMTDSNGAIIWSVGPLTVKKAHLVVQDDGNLVIYKDNKTDSKHAVWSSQTASGQSQMPGGVQSMQMPPQVPMAPMAQSPMPPMGQPPMAYPRHHHRHHPHPPMGYPQYPQQQQNPYFNGELDWTSTKKASVGVGLATGAVAAVLGAPLWGAVLVGSGGTLIAPKIIDFATKLFSRK